jgi:hypothetical protein
MSVILRGAATTLGRWLDSWLVRRPADIVASESAVMLGLVVSAMGGLVRRPGARVVTAAG